MSCCLSVIEWMDMDSPPLIHTYSAHQPDASISLLSLLLPPTEEDQAVLTCSLSTDKWAIRDIICHHPCPCHWERGQPQTHFSSAVLVPLRELTYSGSRLCASWGRRQLSVTLKHACVWQGSCAQKKLLRNEERRCWVGGW